jgi:uncharacterized protein
MNPLHIGFSGNADFKLPLDIVTKTVAVLAQKRVGKSYTTDVLVEELLKAGQVPVVIDYTGAHWGLKSGYPIVIFGGKHADLPLHEGSGELLAQAIVERRFPAIIDLTGLKKGAALRFLAPFLETIYRLNEEPLHIVFDEADAYCPQKPMGEEARTLGAVDDIVRRGGIKGLGCTLVTQRPAVLNKNVLTQCEVLVALRLMHPIDINVIEDWVAVHADPAQLKLMKASLPTLPVGTGWFWSPGLEIFAKVEVRKRRTFDSGKTPKVGEKAEQPNKLAAVDVKMLGDQLAELAEEAKAKDPTVLQRRVRQLEGELAAAEQHVTILKAQPPKKKTEFCPALKISDETLFSGFAERVQWIEKMLPRFREIADRLTGIGGPRMVSPANMSRPAIMKPAAALRDVRQVQAGGVELKQMHRRMLTALAQHPAGLTKAQVLVHTSYASSGPVSTAFADLAKAGYVTPGNFLKITDAGIAALGDYDPLPLGDELRHWLLEGDKLSTMEKALLRAVCDVHPSPISKGDILKLAGYASSGPVSSAFAKLSAYNYVIPQGQTMLKAAEQLFG